MFIVPMPRHTAQLGRSVERLFDAQFFDRLQTPACRAESTPSRAPAIDVAETEAGYSVQLDMPGVAKDAVKITIDGKRVTVSAEAVASAEKKDGERLIYSERAATSYARSFKLPAELNEAESSARLEQGVLTLTLAKRGAGKGAQITVN